MTSDGDEEETGVIAMKKKATLHSEEELRIHQKRTTATLLIFSFS